MENKISEKENEEGFGSIVECEFQSHRNKVGHFIMLDPELKNYLSKLKRMGVNDSSYIRNLIRKDMEQKIEEVNKKQNLTKGGI